MSGQKPPTGQSRAEIMKQKQLGLQNGGSVGQGLQ